MRIWCKNSILVSKGIDGEERIIPVDLFKKVLKLLEEFRPMPISEWEIFAEADLYSHRVSFGRTENELSGNFVSLPFKTAVQDRALLKEFLQRAFLERDVWNQKMLEEAKRQGLI